MALLRRRRVLRLVLPAAVVLAVLAAWLVGRRGSERYVPGAATEGLVDTLARELPADRPATRFTEVARQAGLHFRHFPAVRTNRLPEDMGSGVALGDVDGDGWIDVYLVNVAGTLDDAARGAFAPAGRSRLFRNRGDGTFEDVTDASGAGLAVIGMAAAFLDAEGDGDLDLFVTSYGRCHLLRNDGTGRFEDASSAAGLSGLDGFWTGIAVGDPDRDDDVDVYVCGYVRYRTDLGLAAQVSLQYGAEIPATINPSAFEPERNLLLANRGDGTFEEVAAAAGADNPAGRSLAASFADFDGDGWPDLYVANDVSDNVLLLNAGDGTFTDATSRALVGDYRGAMGLAVGDFDDDLDDDLFITHWIAQENALYVNVTGELAEQGRAPRLLFVDEADRHGLGQIALRLVGWATRFLDVDADGRLDLFVVNGSTIPDEADATRLRPMPTHLFWNAGAERGFFEVGGVSGDFFSRPVVGRGGASFDYDRDGDEDLVIVEHGGPAALLRNDGATGRVLRLRLRQPRGNTFALGARVTLEAGGRRWRRLTGTEGSYLSQHAVGEEAFGLGTTATVDRLEVVWPDGVSESAGPFPADRLVSWTRGAPPALAPLPKRPAARGPPSGAEAQRAFFATLGRAADARLAGALDEAIDLYRSALDLWPGHDDASYYLGHCLLASGRAGEALEQFEGMLVRDPRASRAWMQVGRIRLPGGDPGLADPAAARAAFLRAHEINGEESGPVVALGLADMLLGDEIAAARWFADAAALNSRSVEARYYLGLLAWRRGDGAAAGRWLAEARAAAAGATGRGASPSGEGDTRTGAALLDDAGPPAVATPGLDRWRTLLARDADADAEYAVTDAGLRSSGG